MGQNHILSIRYAICPRVPYWRVLKSKRSALRGKRRPENVEATIPDGDCCRGSVEIGDIAPVELIPTVNVAGLDSIGVIGDEFVV